LKIFSYFRSFYMTSSTRFWIGGGGAMLPLLVTLLAVDLGPLIDHPDLLSVGTYVGAAIRYIVLFAIGGIVAALNSDEVQPVKLVQLGIAAPALISTYVNAQPPKPPPGQPPAARVSMYSFDLVSSAHAAGPTPDDGRIVVAQFFSDVLRAATAPLPRVVAPPLAQDPAAVDRAIENARASAASAAAAAQKAAQDAAKLDHQSTAETITSVQQSAAKAQSAAEKAQQDLKALDARVGAMR
jgi:hypothetical protein